MSCVADQVVIDGGDGVLPQLRLRDPRAEVARDGSHVAVQQLVPRLGERVGELVRVLVEALGDRRVDRVHPQREVRRQHHRGVPLRRIVRVGHGALGRGIRGRPLLARRRGSSSAPTRSLNRLSRKPLSHFVGLLVQAPSSPLVIASAPLPVPKVFFQPRPCVLDGAALGLGTDVARRSAAPWHLPKVWPPTMSATVSSSFIAMRREGLADVPGGGERIRVAVGPLRVHVDQAHLHGAERTGELPVAAVALVAEPRVLGAPEDLVGLPDVLAPEAEAERLEPHRLQGDSCRRRPSGRPRRSSGRTSA